MMATTYDSNIGNMKVSSSCSQPNNENIRYLNSSQRKRLMVNFSSHHIDDNTMTLLENGLGFAMAPHKILIEDIL